MLKSRNREVLNLYRTAFISFLQSRFLHQLFPQHLPPKKKDFKLPLATLTPFQSPFYFKLTKAHKWIRRQNIRVGIVPTAVAGPILILQIHAAVIAAFEDLQILKSIRDRYQELLCSSSKTLHRKKKQER